MNLEYQVAVKPIQPDPIKLNDVQDSIDEGLMALLGVAEIDLIQTYQTFTPENTPDFQTIGPKSDGKDRVLEYTTEDTPYVWIDWGTDGPYEITAKNPSGFLRFKTGGTTKTTPGRFAAMPGTPGTIPRKQESTTHPGIEPRLLSDQEADKLNEIADGIVQLSINDAETY